MDSTAKNSKVKKYVALFALILAGSTIYELPYLSYNYYDVILEAMKMEIPVVAPQDGTLAGINVAVGDAVENGAVLASMN